MTSFTFILGVVPLFVAKRAGAEILRALGISVCTGMLGVTCFGLFLTPDCTGHGEYPGARQRLPMRGEKVGQCSRLPSMILLATCT
jgi:AcrB/AcrD/AcrF family